MSITIKTKLDDALSDRGTYTIFEVGTGPRNLMKAIKRLPDHANEMTIAYGNHGHNGSWIEVNGIVFDDEDFEDYKFSTDPSNFDPYGSVHAISRTEWCMRFIKAIVETKKHP